MEGAALAWSWIGRAGGWSGRRLLDLALPPRCPGCGTITPEVDLFCADCFAALDFMGGGCARCQLPLRLGEEGTCPACLADPGPLARLRSALAYGDIPRTLATRLKYGRKIALARTMARLMERPLGDLSADALLVPVPLHRWRLWNRGFNQALLIARALRRPLDPDLLRRVKATPRLKGLDPSHRRAVVADAFALRPGASVAGRTIILVDDVLTTGATAEACARALLAAGAARVELLSFARVLPPALASARRGPM